MWFPFLRGRGVNFSCQWELSPLNPKIFSPSVRNTFLSNGFDFVPVGKVNVEHAADRLLKVQNQAIRMILHGVIMKILAKDKKGKW